MNALVLDTNLVVLLVVGLHARGLIERHRRTRGRFRQEDFDILRRFIEGFSPIFVTSHSLAEVSNLLRYEEGYAQQLSVKLANVANLFRESHIAKSQVFALPETSDLGVTDGGIIQKAKRAHVLTDDLELYLRIQRRSLAVTNFNHIRFVSL